MKNILYILVPLLVFGNLKAQTVAIPDYRFEQALIDLNIDSDNVINGQILLSDVLNVTELEISNGIPPNYPYYEDNYLDGLIHNLTGIEAFVNLESLTVNVTMIEELNVSNLVNLKYLDCVDNNLTSIDVSNNGLLEYLDISSQGDMFPINSFTQIDLSNNPNIHTLNALGGINKIKLNNGNNNPNMFINVGVGYFVDEDEYYGNVCIEVDDNQAAQNNQYPYSEWTVYHAYKTYSYTDNVEDCSLNTQTFAQSNIKVYPNPVSDILYFESDNSIIEKIVLFDISGRKILEQNKVNNISVSHLQKGSYILKLYTDKGIQAEKIIVK